MIIDKNTPHYLMLRKTLESKRFSFVVTLTLSLVILKG